MSTQLALSLLKKNIIIFFCRETPTSPWITFTAKFGPLGRLFHPSRPLAYSLGLLFQVYNLDRNLTQFRPSEFQSKTSSTAQNESLDMLQQENVKDISQMCFDHLENQCLKERPFHIAMLEIL